MDRILTRVAPVVYWLSSVKGFAMSKPEPAPTSSEFNRFDAAMGHIAGVSKAEVEKRITREKKAKEKSGRRGECGRSSRLLVDYVGGDLNHRNYSRRRHHRFFSPGRTKASAEV